MSGPAIPEYSARRAMPADSFLDQVSRVDLEQATVAADEFVQLMKADRAQVTAIARRLLDPEFKPLLEWLLDITLRRPVFLPNLGRQAVAYCALREGQNQIAWMLLQAIAEGREEQMPPREGL